MKVMRAAADEVFVVEAFDVVGFDGDDIVNVLETAGDEEERFLGDDETEFLEEVRVDDGIGDAGFVFKADEDEAFGGAGTLAANDVAGDADELVVAGVREIGGAENVFQSGTRGSSSFQVRADQGHWVRAGGEVEAGEIGLETFEGVHGAQRRTFQVPSSKFQRSSNFQVPIVGGWSLGVIWSLFQQVIGMLSAFNVPQRFSPMRGKTIECADFGEGAEFGFVEAGAGFKVFEGGEGALGQHVAGVFFADVADHAEAEADGIFWGTC